MRASLMMHAQNSCVYSLSNVPQRRASVDRPMSCPAEVRFYGAVKHSEAELMLKNRIKTFYIYSSNKENTRGPGN